jgi:5-methylcytosine-specific restriction endonuclease McrA
MSVLKRVNILDGHLVTRPGRNHPDPEYWYALRDLKILDQDNCCGVCWRSGEHYKMELHHRHYDTWGEEGMEDVILLCISCHDAVTSVIRSRRMAKGDQTIKKTPVRKAVPKVTRPRRKKVAVPKAKAEKKIVKSRKPKTRVVKLKKEK